MRYSPQVDRPLRLGCRGHGIRKNAAPGLQRTSPVPLVEGNAVDLGFPLPQGEGRVRELRLCRASSPRPSPPKPGERGKSTTFVKQSGETAKREYPFDQSGGDGEKRIPFRSKRGRGGKMPVRLNRGRGGCEISFWSWGVGMVPCHRLHMKRRSFLGQISAIRVPPQLKDPLP